MLLGIVSGLLIIAQAWLIAVILQALLMDHIPREQLLTDFTLLISVFILRGIVHYLRERAGYHCGQVVRQQVRSMVLDKLQELGPVWVKANLLAAGQPSFLSKLKICKITTLAIFLKCISPPSSQS